jgi:tetratricopeptide (TPR) repeat protein
MRHVVANTEVFVMTTQLKRALFACCLFLTSCNLARADAVMDRPQKPGLVLEWSEPRACLQINNYDYYMPYCTHELYNLAMGHLNAGLYRMAIMRFSQILTVKEYALVYGNRGIAYAGIGDLQKARSDVERTIAMNPSLHESWYNLARIDMRQKKTLDALGHINQAIALSPEVAEYHEVRAKLYKRLGKKRFADADNRVAKMIHERMADKDDDARRLAARRKEE